MVSWFGLGDFGAGDYSSATKILSMWDAAAGRFDGQATGRINLSATFGVAPGDSWGSYHGQVQLLAALPGASGAFTGSADWQLRVSARLEPAPGVSGPGIIPFAYGWRGPGGPLGLWPLPAAMDGSGWAPAPQNGLEWAIPAPPPAVYQDVPPPVYDAGHLLTPALTPVWVAQTAASGSWGSTPAPVDPWVSPAPAAEFWNEVERD